MAVCLTGPRRHWVLLGSFIPRLYSGFLISCLFGLNILLTLTLGSHTHFLPESPDIIDDRLLRQKTSKILYDVLPRTCAHHFCNSLLPSTPMYSCINLSFIHHFLVALVITRCLELHSDVSRTPFATALKFFAAWIPLRIIPHTYQGFVHPQLIICLTKFFECNSISWRSSVA